MNFFMFFFILALLVTSLFDAYVLQSYRTNIKRYSRHQSNIVKATSDSMDDSNPVERQLEQFDLLLKNEDCDAQLASRLHMELIMTLFPAPVDPAINRCGMESSAATLIRPLISLPSEIVRCEAEFWNSSDSRT